MLPKPDPNRISGPQKPRKRKATVSPGPPEMKLKVVDLKAALLELKVPAKDFQGLLKGELAELLVEQRRAAAGVNSSIEQHRAAVVNSSKKKKKPRRAQRSSSEDEMEVEEALEVEEASALEEASVSDVELKESEQDDEAEQGEQEQEEEDEDHDEQDGFLEPFDHTSQANLIEKSDPLIIGWVSKPPSWSAAVACEDFDGSSEVIKVRHFSFDTSSRTLLPSWVVASELTTYSTGTTRSPPAELLAIKQPPGHVPYVDTVEAANILLAGPNTAALEAGFLSPLQHRSVRAFLGLKEKELCFGRRKGTRKNSPCPGCFGC